VRSPGDSRRRFIAFAGAGLLLPAVVVRAADSPALVVKGAVENPLALTFDALRTLPVHEYEETWPEGHGAPHAPSKVKGIALRDILDRARLVEKRPRDLRKTIIVADARDGYRAIFTWVELYLSSLGDGVVVVFERDGKPLAESEGPLALVSLKDERRGPRHVKWLKSLEARLVDS
jgi:DMSO/TMAO reductase YedYZ molybdopterin-dependent catalytic subunit